jgi:signal peptidase II
MQNFNSLKIWSKGFFLFLFLVLIDALSKRWALSLSQDASFGFLTIGLSRLGPVFGAINQQNMILRIIHYATFLGPLLLLYFFFSFQFLTLEKSKKLNMFLAIWMAGIVGNILDRIFYGHVIDFIGLKVGFEFLFNLSSLMTCIGAIGFFIHIYHNRSEYIFANNRRLRLLQGALQYDYVGKILFVCLFLCMTISIFSYTFMKFYMSEYGMSLQTQVLELYLTQIMIISGLYLLIILLMAFHFSNRFVGPIHGFEKFIEKLEKGDLEATFRVRENDHHKNLEALAETIKKHWKP